MEVLLDTPFFVKHGRQGIPRWCFIGKMGVAGVASVIRTPSIRAVATVLFGLVLFISILMRSAPDAFWFVSSCASASQATGRLSHRQAPSMRETLSCHLELRGLGLETLLSLYSSTRRPPAATNLLLLLPTSVRLLTFAATTYQATTHVQPISHPQSRRRQSTYDITILRLSTAILIH